MEMRVFTYKEYIPILNRAAEAFVYLKANKKRRAITKKMKERLMLATTQVNGCALCSFVHTKIALSAGMEPDEVKHILAGEYDDIPDEEIIAVLFAQHYAESKEQPSEESVTRLVEYYGLDDCNCITSILEMITMTNAMGITMDFVYERLKFKPVKGSYFLREIAILATTFVLFPILLIVHMLKNVLKMA